MCRLISRSNSRFFVRPFCAAIYAIFSNCSSSARRENLRFRSVTSFPPSFYRKSVSNNLRQREKWRSFGSCFSLHPSASLIRRAKVAPMRGETPCRTTAAGVLVRSGSSARTGRAEARIRRYKQIDLTPEAEAGSCKLLPRKYWGLGCSEQEWQAKPNIPPEQTTARLWFLSSREERNSPSQGRTLPFVSKKNTAFAVFFFILICKGS